jgi:hypothetical protein
MYIEKRFTFMGGVFLFRKRIYKVRPIELICGSCFYALHMGKVSLLWRRSTPARVVPQGFAKSR